MSKPVSLLNTEQAAESLSVSRRTVQRMVKDGRIRPHYAGAVVLFARSEVERVNRKAAK